jgi:hypothetical protein
VQQFFKAGAKVNAYSVLPSGIDFFLRFIFDGAGTSCEKVAQHQHSLEKLKTDYLLAQKKSSPASSFRGGPSQKPIVKGHLFLEWATKRVFN